MNRFDFHKIDWTSLLHPASSAASDAFFTARCRFVEAGAEDVCPLEDSAETDPYVYVPEHYEPNYPYPLLVWVQGRGMRRHEVQSIMPQISTRNYFGVSLETAAPIGEATAFGFDGVQNPQQVTATEESLHEAVCGLRRRYHIHSERIFVAGLDASATLAMELALSHPEWFAGAIALGGRFPSMSHPLRRFNALQGKRILLGSGVRGAHRATAENARIARLLYSAGMEVTTRAYNADPEAHGDLFLDVDRWLMEAICQPEPA